MVLEGSKFSFTSKDFTAIQLRQMMTHLAGEDKCTACRAAHELEKKEQSNSSVLTYLLLMAGALGLLSNDDDKQAEEFNKALLEALNKMNAEKTEKQNGESAEGKE